MSFQQGDFSRLSSLFDEISSLCKYISERATGNKNRREWIGHHFLLSCMHVWQSCFSGKRQSGLTATFTPLVGVRQGCNLSPTLFNIFVNHIVDIFDSTCDPLIMGEYKINCLLYADDLTLLSESEHSLKRCLDRLSCYAKKWQMRIDMKKTN